MRWARFKVWLASVEKRTWIYIACIVGFVAIAAASLLTWMHLSGYTIAEWVSKYYMWLVVTGVALLALVFSFILSRMRGGKF